MIRVLLTLLVFVSSSSLFAGRVEFCDGFYEGYRDGWKRSSGSIFQPTVPLCPREPRRSVRDPIDDFDFGFEVGEDQGETDGRRG
jgi:hypothetical protein